MKKGNWSVVKVLGYVILGIGAVSFAASRSESALTITNTKQTQANQPEPVPETTTPYSPSRHTITLTLNELDELKVTEGQRINPGDIISDRTSTKTKLQAKRERLETAIAQASLPLNQLKAVPIPKFQTELAALKQAQFDLNVITREIENFDKQLHFKDPFYSSVFESEKIQELADLKRRELEASINVEKAIAQRLLRRPRSASRRADRPIG
ncbi:hypothetical protein H1P_3710003 [Hyella patelloides LEGE 07179]|uniref:Uncharacterized protein n=1 Tax=Hyella patelloides LEGE 07179 TaxID=945734 RepID=A0A563VX08_9CYAN|nr:hypothetical protein [Hyella patelloides]VEP15793.1 hypothetical protein H1P_3710003 [Hyella patelloides LEGE 07179]